MSRLLLSLLILLAACTPGLNRPQERTLTLYVEARGLDYSSTDAFIASMERQRSFGHAWLALRGPEGEWTGGHSGELGRREPKYFEGIMRLIDAGDPNPVRYLGQTLHDGFCQRGSGPHRPTRVCTLPLTEEQYHAVLEFIWNYDFSTYSLADHQCCTFVTGAANAAGVQLNCTTTLGITPWVQFHGENYPLWSDPIFRQFTFPSPEALVKALGSASSNRY